MRNSSVSDCNLIELPKIHNRSGNLTAVGNLIQIPFEIRRVYYLYDIPAGADRGGHAHMELHQILVAACGAFDVLLDDGLNNKVFHLNRPFIGLHIVPGIWRELSNFSSGAISLVLASNLFSESDYIRIYNDFKVYKING